MRINSRTTLYYLNVLRYLNVFLVETPYILTEAFNVINK